MNFASIGSIGAYTKALKMETLWKQKTDSGNYTNKANNGSGAQTTEADFLRQQLDEMRDSVDVDAAAVYTKLSTGKKLSASEMAYLKEKDPAAYQKAKEIEAERAHFEEELKRCKTKEDVQRLKTMNMAMSMARVNAIANNANIPKGVKMGLMLQENAKVMAVADVIQAFVESGAYDKLPTEEEREEALKDQSQVEENKEPEENQHPDEIRDPDENRETDEVTVPDDGKEAGGETPETGSKEKPVANVQHSGTYKQTDQPEPYRAPVMDISRGMYGKNLYKETMNLMNEEFKSEGLREIRDRKA